MANNQKVLDWKGIEREYRAGVRSCRDIARAFDCSHSVILRRAVREGWPRDLTTQIAEAAAGLVAREAVEADETVAPVTEDDVVHANATLQAGVIRNHRRDIARLRTLSDQLVQELSTATTDPLSDRIDGTRKLAATLRNLITLERQAFNLEAKIPPSTGLSAISTALLLKLKATLDESDA